MWPKFISAALSKTQIIEFLGLPKRTKESKEQLVTQLLSLIETNALEKGRLLETFIEELAVGPLELESLLSCSRVERKRWIQEGRIPVLEYRSFIKAGQDLLYPVHDRRVILELSQEQIQQWREAYQVQVQERKKAGAQAAVERRKANQQARQTFLSSWQHTVDTWRQEGSLELAAVLQLGYWTVWASRWAKENHIKFLRGTKHFALYEGRRDAWYKLKNEAMYVLAQTPYAHLSFYRPEDADKCSLHLCDEHYEEVKEGFYTSKWDFYETHPAVVKQCPQCHVSIEKDYYSLYRLEITTPQFPDVRFSFHMPYMIGKALFPTPKKLPQVQHVEQEGPFRFGRTPFAYEKITHREQDVQVYLEEVLGETKRLYYVDHVREACN